MKKKIITLALAAFAATGFMSSAQQRAPQNKMYTPQTFTDYAFEGVLLDLPQQQRIDSLHSALRASSQKKVHAITMNPDSAKAMPKHQGSKRPERMNGGAMGVMPGVAYVAKIKEILTPEQFETFISNIQVMPDNVINNLLPSPQRPQRAAMNGKCDGKECLNSPDKCTKSNHEAVKALKDKKGVKATKDKSKKDKK